jgi:hypothetical protein
MRSMLCVLCVVALFSGNRGPSLKVHRGQYAYVCMNFSKLCVHTQCVHEHFTDTPEAFIHHNLLRKVFQSSAKSFSHFFYLISKYIVHMSFFTQCARSRSRSRYVYFSNAPQHAIDKMSLPKISDMCLVAVQKRAVICPRYIQSFSFRYRIVALASSKKKVKKKLLYIYEYDRKTSHGR